METKEAFRAKQLNELLKEATPKEWVTILADVIEGLAFGIDAMPVLYDIWLDRGYAHPRTFAHEPKVLYQFTKRK